MSGQIGLAAYRAETAQAPVPADPVFPERPPGELIWVHAAEPGSARVGTDLAHEIMRQRDDAHVLLTTDTPEVVPVWPGFIAGRAPPDHPGATAGFVRYWKPDMCVWLWGGLRPNLILSTAVLDCPMILADASQSGFDLTKNGWLPEIPQAMLGHFSRWFARSEAGMHRLSQYGVPLEQVEQQPALRPIGHTLPAAESDLEDVRGAMGGRPIWFARAITLPELDVIIKAHRTTMGLAPRLVLVLEPESEQDADEMAQTLSAAGMHVTRWSEGAMPTESTQVLLADLSGEAGLWYRVASVAFLGRSLVGGLGGVDPYEAAAHGSVVIYGPHVGLHKPSYAHLTKGGAAREVFDAPSLAAAVSRLIQPDLAAEMAMAAWDIVTEGAIAMDRIVAEIAAQLDEGRG